MDELTTKPTEHKKLGIKAVLHDFNQKQYEDYHNLLFQSDAKTMAAKNGTVLVCAIKAGILTGVDADAVPSMKPAAVAWLDAAIHKHVIEVTSPPADDPN